MEPRNLAKIVGLAPDWHFPAALVGQAESSLSTFALSFLARKPSRFESQKVEIAWSARLVRQGDFKSEVQVDEERPVSVNTTWLRQQLSVNAYRRHLLKAAGATKHHYVATKWLFQHYPFNGLPHPQRVHPGRQPGYVEHGGSPGRSQRQRAAQHQLPQGIVERGRYLAPAG